MNASKVNYLICGHTGVGKSFLTDCMVNALTEKGVNVVYLTAYELSRMLLDDLNELGNTLVDGLCRVKVLVIDDLGGENTEQSWVLAKVDSILTDRYNRLRPTIITTNLTRDELEGTYSGRILDRLKSTARLLVFQGASERGVMK